MIPIVVVTSQRYVWALRPFAYLFNLYWSGLQPVTVLGAEVPEGYLPLNFLAYPKHINLPEKQWSDGLIGFLNDLSHRYFVLLLEDYWLTRTVDHGSVGTLIEYMAIHGNIMRMDLTTDRLYAGGMFDVEAYGHYDIIETPPETPYQMSLQAAVWNKDLMLRVLEPDKTPWETEIYTHPPAEMRVCGTRQRPVAYANGILKGKIDHDQIKRIPEPHLSYVKEMIPKDWM